jgi:uncharacterized phiE125 gp8 family phage protein
MIAGQAAPIVTLAEAQAFARIETGEEEAIVAGLVRSASGLCEAFLRQVVIERPFSETLSADAEWQRLTTQPVRSLTSVKVGGVPIAADRYRIDVDASGIGWVRITDPQATGFIEVSGSAGLAATANEVPEPLRQGVLRLVAHLFSARDGEGGEIPAAVSALWRPYRRMALA